ncbi:phage protein [Luteimonas sp. S4-F44]|uniref:DUF3653 domain-containing protein n=1 Tax=Luteimonas sp. S4-F44 TaxID=2925842 RepID=UPI001F5382AB|nr:DUF3653 domain-containing protein [Luteimonas sp. S4-F44]UNK44011.1 phage protein [Luteimonas sp. S4-F44]
MRDRALTGPWAGFAFRCGKLVTPEGREFEPEDLAYLALTVGIAQEWRRMMQEHREDRGYRLDGTVVHFRDAVRRRYARRVCMVDDSGPGPGLRANVLRARTR